MEIRGFRAGDRRGCLAVFDSNVPEDFRVEERVEFEGFLAELPGPYLVVRDAGEVVACGGYALEPDGETAALCWGMVARERQGSGLGWRLLEERVALAVRDPAVRRLRLSTSQRTRGFFEKAGFRATEVVTDGIAPGLDRVEMERAV